MLLITRLSVIFVVLNYCCDDAEETKICSYFPKVYLYHAGNTFFSFCLGGFGGGGGVVQILCTLYFHNSH